MPRKYSCGTQRFALARGPARAPGDYRGVPRSFSRPKVVPVDRYNCCCSITLQRVEFLVGLATRRRLLRRGRTNLAGSRQYHSPTDQRHPLARRLLPSLLRLAEYASNGETLYL